MWQIKLNWILNWKWKSFKMGNGKKHRTRNATVAALAESAVESWSLLVPILMFPLELEVVTWPMGRPPAVITQPIAATAAVTSAAPPGHYQTCQRCVTRPRLRLGSYCHHPPPLDDLLTGCLWNNTLKEGMLLSFSNSMLAKILERSFKSVAVAFCDCRLKWRKDTVVASKSEWTRKSDHYQT